MLGEPSYERYKSAAEQALRDYALETHRNPVILKVFYIIWCTRYPEAPPCIFNSLDKRCLCVDRLRECDQCAHEIYCAEGRIFHVSSKDTLQENVCRDPSTVGKNPQQITYVN